MESLGEAAGPRLSLLGCKGLTVAVPATVSRLVQRVSTYPRTRYLKVRIRRLRDCKTRPGTCGAVVGV
ncbi:hypothetical protein JMJ77_0007086 [Colletotrichum scovillei]|uniref:Uncharacterized protein n=1 Tax=Colletotrichum scovillei TaxID=1209932 RepID=A0A9P7UFA5_9PEZI|nr:hypothetical protein JMJ77_0007086 [Colletotrichum scovillei]KAG7074016.1 hypothetical protein JMJ76_0010506 [Colletotrichum scovillei]KAG7081171.1 hypothetical protein JMJ78_0003299 [Colletotrichum scovillei]